MAKKPEPWQLEDAERLADIFDGKDKITQDTFGDQTGIGTQGMVWQYLNGATPLNIKAAYKFAKGLNCFISDFSPRLADEIRAYAEYAYPPQKGVRVNVKYSSRR